MCKALEDIKLEGIEEGKISIIRNMLNRNMSTEDICTLAECSKEFVEAVRQNM